jgi:hypothetical protein
MDSKAEPTTGVDDPEHPQVSATPSSGVSTPDNGQLLRHSADDELLDEFWRRRLHIGHC